MSLLKVAGTTASSGQLYVDDVFSTYLYTGNDSSQTITNGIDLAGKGGLVWIKGRSNSNLEHELVDTQMAKVGSYYKMLMANSSNGVTDGDVTTFGANGFTVGNSTSYANNSPFPYVSWTFRKAAKFFDVVTYTGTGSARTIAHSLGVAPGMIIVKRTDTTGNWQVYSNGLTSAANSIQLNLTDAQASASTVWNSTAPTSSVFSVGTDATVNASGGTYVAYLYAHDTTSTGIIQCGSYTGNGSATGSTISLGWEPQYLMVKNASGTGNWQILDSMRGMPVGSADATLQANLSNAESSVEYLSPTATGFQITSTSTEVNTSGSTYIYMAIRRPNKPPTTGTQVFGLNARTGTGANATVTGGQTDDAVLIKNRGSAVGNLFASRLIGTGYLETSSTAAEVAAGTTILQANPWDVMDGVKVGTTSTITNASANTFINYLFKRAPGFFDVVCYTGNAGSNTQSHNLDVTPELIIIKGRSTGTGGAAEWNTPYNFTGTGLDLMFISRTDAKSTYTWAASGTLSGAPTSTTFPLNSACTNTNTNAVTYVAYLFATLAGISKVGSYTGNGTSQNIECGFAAGARFFLVKATSTTGSWWVWDSARGITAGNDPALQLNSTAAEITTADAVDPYSPGITVNQEATCSINASGVSYIFLAVA